MNFQIGNYNIRNERFCFILSINNNDREEIIGYFSSLKSAHKYTNSLLKKKLLEKVEDVTKEKNN